MPKVRPKPTFLGNEVTKTPRVLTGLVGVVTILAYMLGITPMKAATNELNLTFQLFSWTSFFSFIRLVVFNAPLTVVPLVIYHGGFAEQEMKTELGFNLTNLGNSSNPYSGDMVQTVSNIH